MKFQRLRVVRLAVIVSFLSYALAYAVSQRATFAVPLSDSGQTTNPLTATERNIASGLEHYQAHCAGCHGPTGKADIEKSKAVGAANLVADHTQSKPDSELFRIISKGVPGTAMPAFGKSHSNPEIWQTVLFLRKLPTLTEAERSKLLEAVPATGQQPGHSEHDHHQMQKPAQQSDEHKPDAPAHDMSKMGKESEALDGQSAHGGHTMAASMSSITGGPFRSMSAIGSGTSLMPATTTGYMWHWMKKDWMIMAHGDLKTGFDHQGGPRGVNKAESQNWFMLMAERTAGAGQLMLRGMFSAEPWTAPRRGFPELFQTGETFKGRPIIDAQHPHDLFMELAAAYNIQLSEHIALNFYGGPVAEPALGPVAFMHRMSASENPAAPLGHHWQDSTHISHGVITAGVTAWRFRFESSLFHGAEPDENRKDLEMGKLDSWSGRIWFTPTPNWAMQFSYGHLVHPEALEPGNVQRLTASVSHNRAWDDGNWATALIWGRNHESHGNSNSYLLESTANFLDKNYLYTRMELVDKAGLLETNIFGRSGLEPFPISVGMNFNSPFDQSFRVGAFTFGGVRDIIADTKLRLGIGADVTFYRVPGDLKPIYGSNPTSLHVFLRLRPGKVNH